MKPNSKESRKKTLVVLTNTNLKESRKKTLVVLTNTNLKESRKKTLVVLIDTNFILTCVKQKIDFFEWFKLKGIKIIIPLEVMNELKMLKGRSKSILALHAKFALSLLKKNKFKEIDLKGGDKADKVIIKFARENPDIIIATLDREMKEHIKNKKVTIMRGKMLEII